MKTSRYKNLGPLHDLLLEACPPDEAGKKSIVGLAMALQVSHQYVYRWIAEGRIPPKFAKQITELNGCTVTLNDFMPFVFG